VSSDYSLRCPLHGVDATYADGELAQHNGSTGYQIVHWAAEAGWLMGEALDLEGGWQVFVRGPHDQCVETLLRFSQQHAACGVDVMRDQGGGRVVDAHVKPRMAGAHQ
jgi:hypothetical protein